jgi:hypothetical protein
MSSIVTAGAAPSFSATRIERVFSGWISETCSPSRCVGVRRDVPDMRIPHEKADTPHESAIALDRERPDAVSLPAVEPAPDLRGRNLDVAGLSVEPAHHIGIGDELQHACGVLEAWQAKDEPLSLEQAAP